MGISALKKGGHFSRGRPFKKYPKMPHSSFGPNVTGAVAARDMEGRERERESTTQHQSMTISDEETVRNVPLKSHIQVKVFGKNRNLDYNLWKVWMDGHTKKTCFRIEISKEKRQT